MTVLIYTIGCIVAYIILKRSLFYEEDNDWIDIISRALLSITSWFIVLMIILLIIIEKLPNSKPPKWL